MSLSGPVVPFTIPEAVDRRGRRGRADRRVVRLEGLIRLEAGALVIEWSGATEVTEIRGPEVHSRTESIATTRCAIPIEKVVDVVVRGWWRPRLEIRAADLAALEGVPSAANGRVALRLARSERRAAEALAVNLRDEMADAALRAAEGPP